MTVKRWIPKNMSEEEVDRLFDQLLDDDPETLYANVPRLEARHWPILTAALRSCTDVEARLLLAAGEKSRADVAQFVQLITRSSNCPGCAKKTVASPLARSKGVLAACEAVMREYPPFRVAIAGPFGALVAYGSAKQVKAFLSVRPPDGSIRWIRAVCKQLPSDRAAPFLQLVKHRELDGDEPDEPERYRRRFAAVPPPKPRAPNQFAAPKDAFAAVYAAPELDAPRAVLADLLLEQQEPLGEFIQLQLTRASGKRGTLKRERELLAQYRDKLWPEHPAGIARAYLHLEDTERGFPWNFRNASDPDEETLRRLVKHPGWSTVRAYRGWPTQSLVELFPAEMPQLKTILDVTPEVLDGVRERSWPVEELSLSTDLGKTRAVTGLPRLKKLSITTERELSVVARELLGPSGLLERITELELRTRSASLGHLLDALAEFPKQLLTVRTMGYPYPILSLTRGSKGLDVIIEVEQGGLEDMLVQMNGLAPPKVSSLHFVLATNGFFTKKTRPLAEKAARKVLARYENAKLTSEHPS